MIDPTVPIIEDSTVTAVEPRLEKRTRSWLCVIWLHRRTRWSKPFSRRGISISMLFGGASQEHECWYQVRECLGCGEHEERSV